MKFSRYRPGVAQSVSRCIALLFHNGDPRSSEFSAARPANTLLRKRHGTHFTGGQVGPRAGLDWRKTRPHQDSFPDLQACSQSLYRLSYRAQNNSKQGSLMQPCVSLVISWVDCVEIKKFVGIKNLNIFRCNVFISVGMEDYDPCHCVS